MPPRKSKKNTTPDACKCDCDCGCGPLDATVIGVCSGTDDQPCQIPDIRWITSRDYDAILAIEKECFEFPTTRSELIEFLSNRHKPKSSSDANIGWVATLNGEIIGHVLYTLRRTEVELECVAVTKKYRRSGVAKLLLAKAKSRIAGERRVLKCMVRETNLDGLGFLRAAGFTATGLVRKPWDECDEDGIALRWRGESVGAWRGVNRVGKFFEAESEQ